MKFTEWQNQMLAHKKIAIDSSTMSIYAKYCASDKFRYNYYQQGIVPDDLNPFEVDQAVDEWLENREDAKLYNQLLATK